MAHTDDAGSVNTGECIKGWAQVDAGTHCMHPRISASTHRELAEKSGKKYLSE